MSQERFIGNCIALKGVAEVSDVDLLKGLLGFDVISTRRGVAELFKVCVKYRFLKHLIALHLMILPILGRFYAYGYNHEWKAA